ncbi:MAG TPA: cupin domain-containing protein [Polyangiaceae bacterium]|nr:cupin domain-containing protein [Polyangiaceae bacterium]
MPSFALDALRTRGDFLPFRPGVEIARLYQNDATGASAAVLRYAPGASVPEHIHQGYEHVLVLEGEQRDHRGSYPAGTLVVNAPGTRHTVTSPGGCIALLIWQNPVHFVEGNSEPANVRTSEAAPDSA